MDQGHGQPAVELTDITTQFGAVQALRGGQRF